jgi:hypothetical protein
MAKSQKMKIQIEFFLYFTRVVSPLRGHTVETEISPNCFENEYFVVNLSNESFRTNPTKIKIVGCFLK